MMNPGDMELKAPRRVEVSRARLATVLLATGEPAMVFEVARSLCLKECEESKVRRPSSKSMPLRLVACLG